MSSPFGIHATMAISIRIAMVMVMPRPWTLGFGFGIGIGSSASDKTTVFPKRESKGKTLVAFH